MSSNLKKWLAATVSQEAHQPEAGAVEVQSGETPKEDFSNATNADTTDTETAAPAVAEIPAASDGAGEPKTTEQGHQTTVSTEEADEPKGSMDEPAADVSTGDTNTEVDTAEPVVAEVEPAEAGDDTKTPEADDKVTGDDGNVEVTDTTGAEVSQEALADGDAAASDAVDDAPAVAAEETPQVAQEGHVDQAEIEDALAAFGRMTTALEGYQSIVTGALDKGEGISNTTAQAIQIGLESLDESFGDAGLMPSLESFGQASSCKTATSMTMDGIATALSQVEKARGNAQAMLDKLGADA